MNKWAQVWFSTSCCLKLLTEYLTSQLPHKNSCHPQQQRSF
eukprot:UN22339